MARIVLILGESGNGKSHAIKSLNPETTFLVNIIGKDLPFQGWASLYTPYSKEKGVGNVVVTHHSASIVGSLKKINEIESVKTVIIDDFQYVMSYKFMADAKVKGWN